MTVGNATRHFNHVVMGSDQTSTLPTRRCRSGSPILLSSVVPSRSYEDPRDFTTIPGGDASTILRCAAAMQTARNGHHYRSRLATDRCYMTRAGKSGSRAFPGRFSVVSPSSRPSASRGRPEPSGATLAPFLPVLLGFASAVRASSRLAAFASGTGAFWKPNGSGPFCLGRWWLQSAEAYGRQMEASVVAIHPRAAARCTAWSVTSIGIVW